MNHDLGVVAVPKIALEDYFEDVRQVEAKIDGALKQQQEIWQRLMGLTSNFNAFRRSARNTVEPYPREDPTKGIFAA